MSFRRSAVSRLATLSLGLALMIAAPALGQQEVEVVNDATMPVPVQVDEVLEVVVDNTPSEAIPVSVEGSAPEVPILIQLYEWHWVNGDSVLVFDEVTQVCVGVQADCFDVSGPYYVPDDKVLRIETIGVSGSVGSGSPTTMAADIAIKPPGASEFIFAFGRADYVHPQTGVWQTSYNGPLRAPAGSKLRGGVFWNANVSDVTGAMTISGVLIDARIDEAPTRTFATIDEGSSDLRAMTRGDTSAARVGDAQVAPSGAPTSFPTAR